MLRGSRYLHTRGQKGRATVELTQQLQFEVELSHLLFLSFSLMTMTSSPLDLLRRGLVLAGLLLLLWTSCSPLTSKHGSETGPWLARDASWSSSDGCSSPGQMVGHGIMFPAMLTAEWSPVTVVQSSACCLKLHLGATN